MADFVFMVSAQQIAAFGLFVIAILAFIIALWIGVEWVMEMIAAYELEADDWQIAPPPKDRHHDIH